MSRLLVVPVLLLASQGSAQQLTDAGIAAQIEKARRLVAVDAEGCVKYPQNDEIVVCGENADNKNQRAFRDRTEINNDRIRPGEAVSATKAADCIGDYPKCTHRLQKIVGVGFGYVPPPAIPLEEVLKGLPEPDMIVTNGEPAPPP
jgi:hypothetical protein